MKILLINPPRQNEVVADNPAFIDEERGFNPPLGLLYLAAYIRKNSTHAVEAIDAQVDELTYDDDFVGKIMSVNPDAVGLTVMTFTLIDVVKTIAIIKKAAERLNKKIIVVLGGPHASIYPEETLQLEGVDYVVTGEGEMPLLALLDSLEVGEKQPAIRGVMYLKDGRMVDNGQNEFIENLDDLPFPARELLPVSKYNSILSRDSVVTTMFTSRGCPFQCAFCDRPHLGKRFRARSANNVVDEMEQCLKLGIGEILIYDDTFTVDRRRVLDICDEIIKRRLEFVWDIRARVDTVDEELLRKLKAAGCQRIHFGVEAGTEKILKVLNKGINLSQIESAFRAARQIGLETLAYFMIGAPTETKEDIRATFAFAKKIKPDYTHITIFTPYPATKIYHEAISRGVIKDDYWREFARHPENGVVTRYWEENFTRQELFDLLGEFYRDFYGRPSYMLRQFLKIRSFKDLLNKIKTGLKVLGIKK